MFSRRLLFRRGGLLALSGTRAFAASHFWNKKSPSDWSATEVEQIQTKSPWAKKVYMEGSGRVNRGSGRGIAESMDRNGSRVSSGGMSGADSDGLNDAGSSRGGGGGRRGSEEGALGGDSTPRVQSALEVVVRWDSAKPVLDATRLTLPPDLADHYVLSVTGFPPRILMAQLGGAGNAGERLMHSASLTAKGRDPEVADLVRQIHNRGSLVFGFAKRTLELTAADRDVEFVLKLGGSSVKAKFQPKEMFYRGQLSI